jgi:hypothetical protein
MMMNRLMPGWKSRMHTNRHAQAHTHTGAAAVVAETGSSASVQFPHECGEPRASLVQELRSRDPGAIEGSNARRSAQRHRHLRQRCTREPPTSPLGERDAEARSRSP